jgi:hypothetical protein
MHRAGFTKTRSHPPLQNFAKTDNQKRWKPARMVYTACYQLAGCLFLFQYLYRFFQSVRKGRHTLWQVLVCGQALCDLPMGMTAKRGKLITR